MRISEAKLRKLAKRLIEEGYQYGVADQVVRDMGFKLRKVPVKGQRSVKAMWRWRITGPRENEEKELV